MTSEIEYVQLTKEEAIRHIRELMNIERSVHFGHVLICGVYPQEKIARFDKKDFLHFAARSNGTLIGESFGHRAGDLVNLPRKLADVTKEEHTYYFAQTTILPKWRKKGVGRTLFERKAEAARDLGYTSALAFAEYWNKPIRKIFDEMNAQRTGEFRVDGIGRKYQVYRFDLANLT